MLSIGELKISRWLGLRKNFVIEAALREKLEDLMDAGDLREAIKEATGFQTWDTVSELDPISRRSTDPGSSRQLDGTYFRNRKPARTRPMVRSAHATSAKTGTIAPVPDTGSIRRRTMPRTSG